MVHAAADWMKYGLPLQLLKIVVYDKWEAVNVKVLQCFEEMKAKMLHEESVQKVSSQGRHYLYSFFSPK